jgi:hypothetical protein
LAELLLALAQLAKEVLDIGSESDVSNLAAKCVAHLSQQSCSWLLLLDDVGQEAGEWELLKSLWKHPAGRILATSRFDPGHCKLELPAGRCECVQPATLHVTACRQIFENIVGFWDFRLLVRTNKVAKSHYILVVSALK